MLSVRASALPPFVPKGVTEISAALPTVPEPGAVKVNDAWPLLLVTTSVAEIEPTLDDTFNRCPATGRLDSSRTVIVTTD